MNRILCAAASIVCFAGAAQAFTVDTNNWTTAGGPADLFSTVSWSSPTATSANGAGNAYGTLVSDFVATGNFDYSLSIASTGGDDDNIGVVLGWTDVENHIRIGFEGGGFGDCGNEASCPFPYFADGFWVVQEVGGIATLLFEDDSFAFSRGVSYDLDISVVGGALTFDFGTGGSSLFSSTVNPTAPTDGRVGVYVESQSAAFSDISAAATAPPVPLPASAVLLIAGLGGLGAMARRKKARAA